MKQYRLKKDFPGINKGGLAKWDEDANAYKIEMSVGIVPYRYYWLSRGQVEQNPDWFEEVKEETKQNEWRPSTKDEILDLAAKCLGLKFHENEEGATRRIEHYAMDLWGEQVLAEQKEKAKVSPPGVWDKGKAEYPKDGCTLEGCFASCGEDKAERNKVYRVIANHQDLLAGQFMYYGDEGYYAPGVEPRREYSEIFIKTHPDIFKEVLAEDDITEKYERLLEMYDELMVKYLNLTK